MHGLLCYSMELLLLGKLCMLWQAFFTDPIINYLPSIYCIAGVCRAKFSQQASFNPRNLIRSCRLCIHQADHAQAHEYEATQRVSIGVPEPCQMPAQEFIVQNFLLLSTFLKLCNLDILSGMNSSWFDRGRQYPPQWIW